MVRLSTHLRQIADCQSFAEAARREIVIRVIGTVALEEAAKTRSQT